MTTINLTAIKAISQDIDSIYYSITIIQRLLGLLLSVCVLLDPRIAWISSSQVNIENLLLLKKKFLKPNLNGSK
jgi:hypothetical protein